MILGFSVLPEGEGMIPVPGYPDGAEQIAAVAIVFLLKQDPFRNQRGVKSGRSRGVDC